MSLIWDPHSERVASRSRKQLRPDSVPRWQYNFVCAVAWMLGVILMVMAVMPEVWRQIP